MVLSHNNVTKGKWDGDPDRFQNLMGSKLDQDPSSDFCHEVPFSGILQTNVRELSQHVTLIGVKHDEL